MNELDPQQRLQSAGQELPQESPAMAAQAAGIRMPRQLTAFNHRNYRLFFGGQIVSLTGTWLQSVAQGWLVLQLTNSALLLGVVSSISTLPILFFSIPAGLAADRFPKRSILVITQVCAMILAFLLASLTHFGSITVYHVIAIGFMLGMVNAFDAPTRHSFVAEMVGREDLPNAIALNSAMFNGARIAGPAIAGAVIALAGIAGAFFLNGLSFIAVIAGLLMMKVDYVVPRVSVSVWQSLKECLRFVKRNRTVLGLLILTAVVSIFSMTYAVLMPIFARDILKVGPGGLGCLMSMVGLGALLGAITLSSLGNFLWKGKLLLTGNITFCVMQILFSYSRIWPLSLLLLIFMGWGMMTNMALTNTLIQTSVSDSIRGRVMSLYTLMFLGMAPIGSLQAGAIANALSPSAAMRIGSVICALTAVLLSPMFLNAGERVGGKAS